MFGRDDTKKDSNGVTVIPYSKLDEACARGTRRIIHLNTAYLKPPITALRKHRGGLSCLFASRHDVYRGAGIAGIRDIYAKVMLDEIDESDQPDGDLFRKGDAEIQGPRGWSFWFWIGALGCGCRVRHV